MLLLTRRCAQPHRRICTALCPRAHRNPSKTCRTKKFSDEEEARVWGCMEKRHWDDWQICAHDRQTILPAGAFGFHDEARSMEGRRQEKTVSDAARGECTLVQPIGRDCGHTHRQAANQLTTGSTTMTERSCSELVPLRAVPFRAIPHEQMRSRLLRHAVTAAARPQNLATSALTTSAAASCSLQRTFRTSTASHSIAAPSAPTASVSASATSPRLPRLDRPSRILGVETSCDDTALALLDSSGRLLSHASASQWHLFAEFAGIRPKSAAVAHRASIQSVFNELMTKAQLTAADIDGVAVTAGPGLAPCLEVGMEWAAGFARARSLPFIGVHHMQAHAFVTELDHPSLRYPFLALLISGGHTELWLVRSQSDIVILSATVDDAVGEAFDKVARAIGVERAHDEAPGAAVERLAAMHARPPSQQFALRSSPEFADFTFAGLKSAVMREVLQRRVHLLSPEDRTRLQLGSGSVPRLDLAPGALLTNHSISLLVKEMRAQAGLSKQAAMDPETAANSLLAHLPELPVAQHIELCAAFQHAVCAQLIDRTLRAEAMVSTMLSAVGLAPVSQLVVGGGVSCNTAIASSLRAACSPRLSVLIPRRLHCMDNGIMIAQLGCKMLLQGHTDPYSLRFHSTWPIGPRLNRETSESKDDGITGE